MATYTLLTQMNTPSGAVSQSTSATADAIIEMDVEIPLANDTEVALACEYGQMKGVYLLASKAMTLEVNSGSAPTKPSACSPTSPRRGFTAVTAPIRFLRTSPPFSSAPPPLAR